MRFKGEHPTRQAELALSDTASMNCEHYCIQERWRERERDSPRKKCEVCSSVVWDLCSYLTREMTHFPHHTVSRSHCVFVVS